MLGEDVAEIGERMGLAARELVAAADELDKLARVDVRVAPVLHVLEEFWGHGGQGRGWRCCGGVDGSEGLGEGFTGGLLNVSSA